MAEIPLEDGNVEFRQLTRSIYNLINGQLLLAECFADTSESIRNSVSQLTKSIEDLKCEMKTEISDLKTMMSQLLKKTNDSPESNTDGGPSGNSEEETTIQSTIIAPQLADEMFNRLCSVALKLDKLQTDDVLNKNGTLNSLNGCRNFQRMLSSSVRGPIQSKTRMTGAVTNNVETLPIVDAGNANSIVIKTEVIKLDQKKEPKHGRGVKRKQETKKKSSSAIKKPIGRRSKTPSSRELIEDSSSLSDSSSSGRRQSLKLPNKKITSTKK